MLGVWLGDGPTVLFIHGWSGRGSQFYEWVNPLVKAGYSVVFMDASGHGDSDGKMSSLPEFRDAILAVSEQIGPGMRRSATRWEQLQQPWIDNGLRTSKAINLHPSFAFSNTRIVT
jgi:pimeloyl-ACP methyl ester carboxylesterase